MTCMLCNEDYGYSFCQNENCSYPLCKICVKKLTTKKCPNCRGDLPIKMFFAGKIELCHKHDICENTNTLFYHTLKPCESTKRYIIPERLRDDNGDIIDDYESKLDDLRNDGQMELSVESIIKYEDYVDLNYELPVQIINDTLSLTGPCVMLNLEQELSICHGLDWSINDHIIKKKITDNEHIVNKRNDEMIEKCDVFSLRATKDSFKSFTEWGMAKNMGKILVLNISDFPRESAGELYLFAQESIESFERISFLKRNAILQAHPEFNMSYSDYKKIMEELKERKYEAFVH